jgi:diacylglycerol kinase family enzyme
MEGERSSGRAATPGHYVSLTLRKFFRQTDRRRAALRIMRTGQPDIDGVFLAIVQNTSPWTYLGSRPLNPCPDASFDTGLDVLAWRDLGVLTTLNAFRRMATQSGGANSGSLSLLHDQPAFEVRARRPVAVQADGEALGLAQAVAFASHPAALRVAI